MLDSGAFTYQVKGEAKGEASKLPTPEAYFEEYYGFLREYGDLFDIIAELDIDGYVSGENGQPYSIQQVDEWTNRLLELPVIGTRIMPVYHLHRGKLWLRDWLADTSSPLVGFASSAVGGGPAAAMISMAHRFGKWVHGFGQTRIKTDMKYMPFNSVDSTTWLRADRYGGSCYFINGKFIVLDHKHKQDRARYRDYYLKWGLDPKLIMKDDLYENRKATIIAWRELANDMERRVTHGTREPYLCEYLRKHGRMPDRHPLLVQTAARMQDAQNAAAI
jgi:hypothetical protein